MSITGFSELQKYRYVGEITGFSNAKTVVILKDTSIPDEFCHTTRYCGLLTRNQSSKICLTPHNLILYTTIN
jgi:hypothetical protein